MLFYVHLWSHLLRIQAGLLWYPIWKKKGTHLKKYIPTAAVQKQPWAQGCPCHPSVSSYFTWGKRGSRGKLSFQQEICLILLVLQSLRQLGVCWRKRKIKYRAGQGRTKLTWLKADPNFSCCKFGGRHAVPSFLPHHSHTQNNLKLVVKKINCRESPWRALAANCSH